MRTIDGQFTPESSLWQRFNRDRRLLFRMAKMVLSYFIEGRRIRRLYRDKQALGKTLWVDEELKP